MFSWLRDLKRRQTLSHPFPPEWEASIVNDVPHDACLDPEERRLLRQHIQVFIAEKHWEAAGGLEMTDEIRVTIAAQACLLLLGLPNHDFYPNLNTIIVYPNAYHSRESHTAGGITHEGVSARLGEAWPTGQVVLNWNSARHSCRKHDDGHNVVLHEFAHLLDMRDGFADGVPSLPEGQEQYDQWAAVMAPEYARLVEEAEEGRVEVLDGYGATDHAEFFAVATECFFEKPLPLQHRHPRLYAVLKRYYRQDTAARAARCLLHHTEAEAY